MAAKRSRWQDVDKSQIPIKQPAPKTVELYSEKLNRFLKVLGGEARLRNLSIDAVRRYQRASRVRGGSKFSQHAYLRSVKTFLRWLGREGFLGQGDLARGRVAQGAEL